MPGPGFVHQPLDVKVVILYNMARVAAPIDYDTLIDLSLCDPGIDYFLLAPAVDQLVESEHLMLGDDGLYPITQKGRTNGGVMESTLSSVVRDRCDQSLARVNATLRRNAQITAQVVEDGAGRCHVELGLSDDLGPILDLRLTAPSPQHGQAMTQRFRECPEDILNAILSCLLHQPQEKEEG